MTRLILAGLCAATTVAVGATVLAQQLPDAPAKGFGTTVTGAFEGWYDNPDGTHTFLVGYYNRNIRQAMDIPIGPNNHVDPGGPDMGQPTHFLPGRQWGMFAVPVPKDFKEQDSLTWTITANGQTNSIPLRLKADYVMSPFKEISVGNTPPAIRFEPAGSAVQGPLAILARAPARTASLAEPFA